MKIERTFRNDVSDEQVIKAEFSAQEILQIFSKTNEYTDYVCHALYAYIKSKIAKKGNPLNRAGVCMGMVSDKFSYHTLGMFEEHNGVSNELTMSYQVMEWLQTQLEINTNEIHSHLGDCDEIYVKYFQGSRMTMHQGRITLLSQIAAKQNVPNLKLVFSDV
jgi:hypothetical protein